MFSQGNRWYLTGVLVIFLTLPCGLEANAQRSFEVPSPITPDEMLEFFKFSREDVEKLEKGEVLSVDLPELESSGKTLAVGLAMVVPHGVDDCSEQFAGPEMFRVDPNMLAFGRIDREDVEGSLRSVAFSADEKEEAEEFLQAGPGSDFNLSQADIQRIKASVTEASSRGATALQIASEALRELLTARFSSYEQKGLKGIDAYARSSRKTSSPARDLELALAQSPIVQKRLPAYHKHLLRYPNDPAEGAQERFYWLKRDVDGRPMASLIHWSLFVHPEFAFLSEREFYVSHTYNAQQVFLGVLPYEGGVIIFYLNRTFTDQVDIFAKSLAHRIGRGRLEEPLREALEKMRAQVAH